METAERASIDFTLLLNAAIQAKAAEEIKKLAQKEQERGDVQKLRAEGRAATTWYVTPEQLERMNNGDQQATDDFFADNAQHIKNLAFMNMRKLGYYFNPNKKTAVEIDDLINQAYLDIRLGKIIFDYTRKSIGAAISHSMRYAPFGGMPDDWIYHYTPRGQPRKMLRKTK